MIGIRRSEDRGFFGHEKSRHYYTFSFGDYDDPAHRHIVRELKGVLLDWLISADENDQIARKWLI